jgi:hypothetical protein
MRTKETFKEIFKGIPSHKVNMLLRSLKCGVDYQGTSKGDLAESWANQYENYGIGKDRFTEEVLRNAANEYRAENSVVERKIVFKVISNKLNSFTYVRYRNGKVSIDGKKSVMKRFENSPEEAWDFYIKSQEKAIMILKKNLKEAEDRLEKAKEEKSKLITA